LQNHGEACDTYRTALDYKRQLSEIESRRTEDNEYDIDNEVEDLEQEFVKAICEDYLTMLRGEYEYLTSREAIEDSIESNDWDFDNRGRIASNLLSWNIPYQGGRLQEVSDILTNNGKFLNKTERNVDHKTIMYKNASGGISIKYWNTDVIAFYDDRIVLDNGGYNTPTTKSRMNFWLQKFSIPGSVFSKQGAMLYSKQYDYDHPYKFKYNEIRIDWEGTPIGDYEQLQPKPRRQRRVQPEEQQDNQLELMQEPDIDTELPEQINNEASLGWDIPINDFEVGDKVRIFSKSIYFSKTFSDPNEGYICPVSSINLYCGGDDINFANWESKPSIGETYYTVNGNFYLAQDLELVKKTEASLDNEVENEYIESNNSKDNYGQHNDYSQYSLFNTAENYKEAEDEPTPAPEGQQAPNQEVQQDTKKTELNISYPSTEEIIDLHNEILSQYGGKTGIFPEGEAKLEAAIGRMQSGMGETEFYPTLVEKAAVLIHSIITTHPFLDGNKRTAFLSGVKFLHLQGISIEDSDNVAEIIIQIADGKMSYEQLRDWLKEYSSHFMDKHERALLRLSWNIEPQAMKGMYQFKNRNIEDREYGIPVLICPYKYSDQGDAVWAFWCSSKEAAESIYENFITPEVIEKLEIFVRKNPDYTALAFCKEFRRLINNDVAFIAFWWMPEERVEECKESVESWDIPVDGRYAFSIGNRVRLIRDEYAFIGGIETLLKLGLKGTIINYCGNPFYYSVLWDKYPEVKEGLPIYFKDMELI
jgi:death-on-curing protein